MQIIVYLSIVFFFTTSTIQNNWEKEFTKDGITVYTKTNEGSNFKAFKGEILLESNINDLVSIILDVEKYANWCYRTSSVRLLKTEENKIFYYYVSEAPLVIKDREAYLCSELIVDEKNNTTTITMNVVNSTEPVPNGFVRMPYSKGYWKFTSINKNKTFVTFQMHAEPGGMIPSWLANLVSTESPWVTLNNLRSITTKP